MSHISFSSLATCRSFCKNRSHFISLFSDHHNETGGCPDDWYRLDDKCYSLGGLVTPLTWQEARDWCSVNGPPGGNLATIYHPGLQCKYSSMTAGLKVVWRDRVCNVGSSSAFQQEAGAYFRLSSLESNFTETAAFNV